MTVSVASCEAAVRMMEILRLFGERHIWTTEELAERLGVGQRAVQRYLLYLSTEPFYVPFLNDDTCWSVPADWRPRL